MIKIPVELNGGSYLVEKVNLNKTTLYIRLIWNWVDQHWFADFESANGKRTGIRIVANSLLLCDNNGVLDEGAIVILKRDASCQDALNHDNLGSSYILHYLTDEDVVTFREAGLV